MSIRALRIIATLLAVGVCWLLLSFLRLTPDDVRDFSTVTGTLLSAEEHISGGKGGPSGYLEIRLRESSIRYCVPADGYRDCFRRKAFFAEVHKGATVHLTALASNIATPPYISLEFYAYRIRPRGESRGARLLHSAGPNHLAKEKQLVEARSSGCREWCPCFAYMESQTLGA